MLRQIRQPSQALNVHQVLNSNPNIAALATLLKRCGQAKALDDGRLVHAFVRKCSFAEDTFLGNWLIKMYGDCGSVAEACLVFGRMRRVNLHSWNMLMKAYALNGFFRESMTCLEEMQLCGTRPDHITFICALDACSSQRSLEEGRRIHTAVLDCGFEENVFVGTALIDMYGKCSSLEDAKSVFTRMQNRNVVTWNAMMGACAINGDAKETLNLLEGMQEKGLKPNDISLVRGLDACSGLLNLEKGKELHRTVVDCGYEKHATVGNALVKMYGKCGSSEDAMTLFGKLEHKNVNSWNTIMSACNHNGHPKETLDLYEQMLRENVKPNEISFVCALDACTSLTVFQKGKQIHAAVVDAGYGGHKIIGTSLVNMYGKCGRLKDATAVFDRISDRDVAAWNSIIAACVQNGQGTDAINMFDRMQRDGIEPNHITFVSTLDACAIEAAHEKGRQIHYAIVKGGYEEHVVVGTALINMYSKLGKLEDAKDLFNKMPHRDVISWNAMMAALTRNGLGKEALDYFDMMQKHSLKPDHITYVCALDACASLAALKQGREIHAAIIGSGCDGQVILGTSLVNMYGKCRSVEEAKSVFIKMPRRNIVTWNAIIAACSQNGHCSEALELFNQMHCDGITPNQVTYLCALDACASLAALEEGQQIHKAIKENGYEGDVAVANALINMYGKCQNLEAAQSVFHQMLNRDVISWNAMISSYCQNGHGKEALEYFQSMQLHKINPDQVTYICALDASASLAALDKGQGIHAAIVRNGYEKQVIFGNALISMYGKCGIVKDAKTIFDKMPNRDVISWNTMIAAFAQNGHDEEALDAFNRMQHDGFKPDQVTFLSVLAACNHSGRVEDAKRYFDSMSKDHGLVQNLDHYMCLVDLLGRADLLDDAEKLINSIPFQNKAKLRLCLLGACRVHGDVKHGIHAASHVFEMDP